MKWGEGEEKQQGEGGFAETVQYQSLVIENAFHICLQRFAFGLGLLILLNQWHDSHWPEPKPVYTVVKEDMFKEQQLH